jgi:peptidyl-prolyl cis-trans isomerase C
MMVWRHFPIIAFLILLSGCSGVGLEPQATATLTPAASQMPTPTSVPLAATVNGEGIPLEDFNLEVARFERAQATLGVALNTLGDYAKRVLESMVEERVAAQAANTAGLSVAPDLVEATYRTAEKARGGPEGMQAWLKDNLYTEANFRETLARQMLVQRITGQIADQTPRVAEQVHARHILVGSKVTADYLLGLLTQGISFENVARKYSQDLSTRDSGGDLGWFARGTLLAPEVEEAAFGLEVGKTTPEAVQSKMGFHIIQTLEKQSDRSLSPVSYELLRRRAVQTWLAGQVAQAKIQIFVTTAP